MKVTIPPPPRRAPERIAWLRALDEAIALDVLTIGDELLEAGWTASDILPVLLDLGRYIADRVIDAAAMGADLWGSTR